MAFQAGTPSIRALKFLTSPSPPSPDPGAVLFETERLVVRRYLPSDAASLAEIGNDPEIAAVMSDRFPSPYTVEAAEEWINEPRTSNDPPPEYPSKVGIFLKGETPGSTGTTMIGSMGVRPRLDVFRRSWEIGYFLGRASWGKGYAVEAVTGFVRWMFETWPDLMRIEAGRFDFNVKSGRVLEKSGFVLEGVKRGAVFKNGVMADEVMYGLLRSEMKGVA